MIWKPGPRTNQYPACRQIRSAPRNRKDRNPVIGITAKPSLVTVAMGKKSRHMMMKRDECRVYERGSGVRRRRSQPPRMSLNSVTSWCICSFCAFEMLAFSMSSDRTCRQHNTCTQQNAITSSREPPVLEIAAQRNACMGEAAIAALSHSVVLVSRSCDEYEYPATLYCDSQVQHGQAANCPTSYSVLSLLQRRRACSPGPSPCTSTPYHGQRHLV